MAKLVIDYDAILGPGESASEADSRPISEILENVEVVFVSSMDR